MVTAVADPSDAGPLVVTLEVLVSCVHLVRLLFQLLQATHTLLHLSKLRIAFQAIRHELVEKLPVLHIALLEL